MTASTFISKSITAENDYSNALQLDKGQMAAISLSGIAGGSVVWLQRNINGANWRDVSSYTADAELGFVAECGMQLRLGIKTGGYGSGTTVIEMKVG